MSASRRSRSADSRQVAFETTMNEPVDETRELTGYGSMFSALPRRCLFEFCDVFDIEYNDKAKKILPYATECATMFAKLMNVETTMV